MSVYKLNLELNHKNKLAKERIQHNFGLKTNKRKPTTS